MMPTTQAGMGFLYGGGFFAVLLAGLAVAALLGAHVWRRTGSAPAQFTAFGSASLLACIAMWAALTGLFRVGDIDPRLWVGPFDRMLLIVSLLALAWTATSASRAARRWRPYLVGALGATLLLYLHWATTWARELSLASTTVTADPTGLARAWDIALAALAVAIAIVLWRWVPKAPGWMAWVLGGIAIGSLLELVAPVSPLVPLWSRLGAVAAGFIFVSAALVQTAELAGRDAATLLRFRSGRRDDAALAPDEPVPAISDITSDITSDISPDITPDLTPAAIVDQTLVTMAHHLGADPCFGCLLTTDGDFDVRAFTAGRDEPRRVGSLPLTDHPTLQRTLHEGALSLERASVAPDVARLLALTDAEEDAAVMLQRVGTGTAHGVLVAARGDRLWTPTHQALFLTIAARVAVALDGISVAAGASDAGLDLPSPETQAEVLGRLSRIVEHVGERVEQIESQMQASDHADGGDADAPEAESAFAGSEVDQGPAGRTVDAEATPAAADEWRAAGEVDETPADAPVDDPAAGGGVDEAPADAAVDDPAAAGGVANAPADAAVGDPSAVGGVANAPAKGDAAVLPRDAVLEDPPADGDAAAETDGAWQGRVTAVPVASTVDRHAHEAIDVDAIEDAAARASSSHLHALVPPYERALERVPWGVAVLDADGFVAYANAAAANLLHHERLEAGAPLSVHVPSPDRLTRALRQLRQRPDTDLASPVDVRFTAPDVRIELEPLIDPIDGLIGALATIHPCVASEDISIEELVPSLADAIRAPMTSILGYSDVLTRGPDVPEEQLGRFLHRIDANLARMQVMLNNLLTVLEMEDAPLVPESVDVPRTVDAAIERARAQLDEKGLAVRNAVGDGLPLASAEPEAVRQIVDNLMLNAAIRSPQGGDVIVDAELREADGARAIVLSVHDRGAAIAGGATGVVEIDEVSGGPVALRIVRLLAARQGGRAWAQGEKHGARFFVRLPVRESA